MEKIKTDKVILVEGKYDKIKLSSLIDATIITTDGFSVFNNEEKCSMLRKISRERGIIILTDSDGAGFVIRNKLKGIIGDCENITNLYIPNISGKEKRKDKQSKQGFLGVEGIDDDTLRDIFTKAGIDTDTRVIHEQKQYTKTDLYELGLSGKDDSKQKREQICKLHSLPCSLSANAFLEAVNILNIPLKQTSD